MAVFSKRFFLVVGMLLLGFFWFALLPYAAMADELAAAQALDSVAAGGDGTINQRVVTESQKPVVDAFSIGESSDEDAAESGLQDGKNVSAPTGPTSTFAGSKKKVWYRLAGQTEFDTMQQIVKKGWGATGGTVVVATSQGFQDALAATAVAGLYKAPVLMTKKSSLPAQTEAELKRLKPKKVVVPGGPNAVSHSVFNRIKAVTGADVQRVYGDYASDTAAQMNLTFFEKPTSTAILATSQSFYDALSVAPIAYAKGYPIFLTEGRDKISANTLKAIKECGITTVYIIGGAGAIRTQIEDKLRAYGVKTIKRKYGHDHYDTSEAVAKWGISLGLKANNMGVATSESYYDALCGAALCGKTESVLVLADDRYPKANSYSQNASVPRAHYATVSRGYVFGGKAAVSPRVYNAFANALGAALETGWIKIGQKLYYYNDRGEMATMGYLNGYLIAYDGVCHKVDLRKTGNKDADARRVAKLIAKCCGPRSIQTDLERVGRAACYVSLFLRIEDYTTSGSIYHTAYGAFIGKQWSCAGSTRALGLVLDYLGYSWTHRNPNKWTHQWCKLTMDGKVGYADAAVLYGGSVGYGRYKEHE